jgi:hypothetical protein
MKEKDLTTEFLKWSRFRLRYSFCFEAKICKDPSLPFASVKEHQEHALFRAHKGVMNYKIPDDSFGEKPFDGFQFYEAKALIVIFWYQKRGDRRVSVIPIMDWLEEKQNSKRKSITYDRSCEIGECFVMEKV